MAPLASAATQTPSLKEVMVLQVTTPAILEQYRFLYDPLRKPFAIDQRKQAALVSSHEEASRRRYECMAELAAEEAKKSQASANVAHLRALLADALRKEHEAETSVDRKRRELSEIPDETQVAADRDRLRAFDVLNRWLDFGGDITEFVDRLPEEASRTVVAAQWLLMEFLLGDERFDPSRLQKVRRTLEPL